MTEFAEQAAAIERRVAHRAGCYQVAVWLSEAGEFAWRAVSGQDGYQSWATELRGSEVGVYDRRVKASDILDDLIATARSYGWAV